MQFRHEWKYEINASDKMILRQRLRAVAAPDTHSDDGFYTIRSLYFDDLYDTALMEKINGVGHRVKFRIRYYNGDTTFIRIEKKSKVNGLCAKESAVITKEECWCILNGDYSWMINNERKIVQELYVQILSKGLRPKTIVDYTREPFVYAPGNVRVTIDDNIRTSLDCRDFLNWDCPTIPAGDPVTILEVKWDEFLPDIIRDVVQIPNRQARAFSKYAACRIYG